MSNILISLYVNKQVWVEDIGHPECLKISIAVWDEQDNTVFAEAMFKPGCFDLIMGEPHQPWSSMQDWVMSALGDGIDYLADNEGGAHDAQK